METAVYVSGALDKKCEGKFWKVEYKIPFKSIKLPVSGDTWRMNLYRIDSPRKNLQELYAWNPTHKRDFHQPWLFGSLLFE